MTNRFLILVACYISVACGVKGDPLPPLEPVELGRGRPVFKGATKDIDLKPTPSSNEKESDDNRQKRKK